MIKRFHCVSELTFRIKVDVPVQRFQTGLENGEMAGRLNGSRPALAE
jgi:hypothetical protein